MDPCLIKQGASNIAPECRKMHLRVMNFKSFQWSMPPDLPYLGGPSAPPIKISIYLLAMFHLPIWNKCYWNPCSPLKCALVYRKNSFSVKRTMSLSQKKSDKHVVYRYMLSKKLQATYKGQICRKQLAVAWNISLCKLTCETIFMIDIDEMLPKLLHRLKHASIYLKKIQNVLTKQKGSTV